MSSHASWPRKLRLPVATRSLSVLAGAAVLTALAVAPAGAATAIGLGTADSFAILAGSGITNTGATTITGDVGTFPTPSMTGFGTVVLAGVNHGGDAVTQQAKQDLTTAYDQAFASAPAASVATELGGTTLTPGVYHGATLGITGTLTLDTQGDPDAVFVFQAGSTLITASASRVVVLGAQRACNVFWQVGSSATLGSSSVLVGSVLAATSITADNGATVEGRLLARDGAVTLDHNTITARTCAAGGVPGGPATTVATPTGDGAGAAAPGSTSASETTSNSTSPPTTAPSGLTTGLTELPRTGISDWLPLAGATAIALGLLLVRLGTPRLALRHAVPRGASSGRRHRRR